MRKLLLAGAVLAAPLLGLSAAKATPATPLISADQTAVASPSIQKAYWVWAGPRRVWVVRPYAYWHPYWRWHHWIPGHWAWGHWVPGHYV